MLHLSGSSHCSSRASTVKVKLFRRAGDPKETESVDYVEETEFVEDVWKLLGRENSMSNVFPDGNVVRTEIGHCVLIPELLLESSHHSIMRMSFPLISTVLVFSSDVELKI